MATASWRRSNRLLKKAHLRRWRACAALRRTRKYASHPASCAALHLDLFEQPGRKRVFRQPVKTANLPCVLREVWIPEVEAMIYRIALRASEEEYSVSMPGLPGC